MSSMTSLITAANKRAVTKVESKPRSRNLRAKRIRRLTGLRDRVIPAIDIKRLDFDRFVCSTFMCLGGWAATDPWFRAAGLMLDTKLNIVRYADTSNFFALAKFFMIEKSESLDLFWMNRPLMRMRTVGEHLLTTDDIHDANQTELARRVDMITALITKYGGK